MGPIPSAEEFAKYKEVMPDLPERLVKQFEEDSVVARELQKSAQKADIELQKEAQKADIEYDKRNQWMAFVLIFIGIVSTFVLAYFDKDAGAVATGMSTLLMVLKSIKTKPPEKSKTEHD